MNKFVDYFTFELNKCFRFLERITFIMFFKVNIRFNWMRFTVSHVPLYIYDENSHSSEEAYVRLRYDYNSSNILLRGMEGCGIESGSGCSFESILFQFYYSSLRRDINSEYVNVSFESIK